MLTKTRRHSGVRLPTIAAAFLISLAPTGHGVAVAQGNALAIGQAFAPVFPPLRSVRVPDVNEMGLLESSDWWSQPANANPLTGVARDYTITQGGNKQDLVQLGYSLFWDMQVGSDGIQACASCHFHMGADHRDANQLSPGILAGDNLHDVGSPNSVLMAANYGHPDPGNTLVPATGTPSGFPHDENALIAAGSHTPDGPDGGFFPVDLSLLPGGDANDVASSQGHRLTTFTDIVADNRHDNGLPELEDSLAAAGCGVANGTSVPPFQLDLPVADCGFNNESPFTHTVSTVRRVEPRNTPSAHHAVFNARNFLDGRANFFFNMVNPFGMLDPDAQVPRWDGAGIEWTVTLTPQSALASQSVGPPLSFFEMSMDGRSFAKLGKKMSGAKPLAGQEIRCDDAFLGSEANIFGADATDLLGACGGTVRGIASKVNYDAWIKSIFDETWWGDGSGNDVCVSVDAVPNTFSAVGVANVNAPADCAGFDFTLLEFNFAAFFGLAVQAYEAVLFTDRTMMDVMGGDHPMVTSINNSRGNPVNVTNLPLEQCVLRVRRNNKAVETLFAENACLEAFADELLGEGVVTGPEGYTETVPERLGNLTVLVPVTVAANTVIDLATDEIGADCNAGPTPADGALDPDICKMRLMKAVMLKVDRGIGRFQAGATGCMICHVGANLTGATVDALTGFGAPPPEVVAPGLPVEAEAFLERMVSFSGRQVVYDSGFYNIGNRPTPEDIAIGGSAPGDVPLAHTQLLRELLGFEDGSPAVDAIGLQFGFGTNPVTGQAEFTGLRVPLSPAFPTATPFANQYAVVDLTGSEPFTLEFICGPGVNLNAAPGNNGNRGGNNRPVATVCPPNLLATDQFLRNGAFKTPGLRGNRGTGPYFHSGNKKDLRELLEFYKHAGDFPGLNLTNLDAGIRIFNLDGDLDANPATPTIGGDETAVIEFLATGLTGWDAFYERGKFGHPELCVPNGHDAATGKTVLVGIPATVGNDAGLQTFDELMHGVDTDTAGNALNHTMDGNCTVPGMASAVAAVGADALVDPLVDPEIVVPVLGFEITGGDPGTITVGVTDVGLTVVRAAYRVNATDPWTDVVGGITGDVAGDGVIPNWSVAIPGIADGDEVDVTILDAAGNVTTATGTAFVNDAPVFTSGTEFNVSENDAATFVTLTATDEEDDGAGLPLTFSIVTGDDAGAFTLTGANLAFTAPGADFETPTDVGGTALDNVYVVTVRATDSLGVSTDQTITVTVTDVLDTV